MNKIKILFTTPTLEYPAAGGPQLRIENSIKVLNKICQLHVISRVNKELFGGDVAQKYYKKYCQNFLYSPSACDKHKYLFFYRVNKIKKLFFGKAKSYYFDDYLLEADINFILNYIKDNSIEIIWFGYGNISYDLINGIRKRNPHVKIICDTDSVLSRYLLRGLPYEKSAERYKLIEDAGKKKEDEEIKWVKICDVTTAVSDVDAQYYKNISNNSEKIKFFSNVIDLENYSKIFNPHLDFKKPCIYLAGSFGPKSPMDQAARWFIKDVFPLVRDKCPEIHFYIIGSRADSTLNDVKDDSITIVGKVESVLPYLQNADVAIVPLMFESGTRFKIIEAGACGIPVVSTILGAEGLDVTNGRDIFIADEPRLFADNILKLIKDESLSKGMGENLKILIKKQYGLDKLITEGISILEFLTNN